MDQDFIAKKTAGFEALAEELKRYDLNFLSEQCGISVESLKEAAQMIASKKRMIICWGMGITQQHNGVEMIYNIVNLLLMKGASEFKAAELVLYAVTAMYRETEHCLSPSSHQTTA